MHLLNLQDYNAKALSDFIVQPVTRELKAMNNSLVPVISSQDSVLRNLKISVMVKGYSAESLHRNISRLYYDLKEDKELTQNGEVFYRGEFQLSIKHKYHNQTKAVVEINGICEVVSDVKEIKLKNGITQIENKGTLDSLVEIEVNSDVRLTGLTEQTLILKRGDIIKDNGYMELSKDTRVYEFPTIKPGLNTIKADSDNIVIRYRERYL